MTKRRWRRRAVELRPDAAAAHNNLGHVLHRAGKVEEAISSIRRAIELAPKAWNYYINLAAALDVADRVDESIAAAEEALKLGAQSPDLLSNISTMERRRRGYRAAVDYADRAIKLMPNHAAAHGSRGLALLALGDYTNGFAEYEWRWRCANFTTAPRELNRPVWDGSDPAGRKILVHSEQGFGDTLQFARYVPMLAVRGATVFFECHTSLRPLLQNLNGVNRVIPAGLAPPDFDLHAPLMSLPRAFGTTGVDTIPAEVPYLHVDDPRRDAWRERIKGPGFKVGLTWWGNAKPDPQRSCPLHALTPLGRVPGVVFYALQKGEIPADAASAPEGMNLINLSSDLKDFADTAAAMMAVDLVITIDTASAAPRRCTGPAHLDAAPLGARLALAARSIRLAVVSDDAALPAKRKRQLGRCRRHRGKRTFKRPPRRPLIKLPRATNRPKIYMQQFGL